MWYRSLYWRIGLGFITLLAVLLVSQGLLVVWFSGQADEWLPIRSPFRLATLIASDLGNALTQQPNLVLDKYVHDQFTRIQQPFFVVMADGRVASNREGRTPPGMIRAAREKLGLPPLVAGDPAARPPNGGRGWAPGAGRGWTPDTERGRAGADARGRGQEGGRGTGDGRAARFGEGPRGMQLGDPFLSESEPIDVNGTRVGLVVVLTRGDPFALLRQFGPMLAIIGIGLLAAGTVIGTLVIFRPARLRMRNLQEAVASFGAGNRKARASEHGHDEVTELARAFNRMAEALGNADTVRRRLLADVSHELKTPLTAMRGYIETLTMTELALDPDTQRRYLGIVGEETEKLESMIGDLLDLARLEGGGTTLTFETVPVQRLFDRVADRHAHAIADKHLTLDARADADAVDLWGDAGRLEQALQNLAANAIRHTPDGGRITLRATRIAGTVQLTVRDTGPGIPPEHLSRVFNRFYKVEESRTGGASAGSGLGLSIVKAIVELHGGGVSATTAEGGGAEFTVRVPERPTA